MIDSHDNKGSPKNQGVNDLSTQKFMHTQCTPPALMKAKFRINTLPNAAQFATMLLVHGRFINVAMDGVRTIQYVNSRKELFSL